MDHEIVGDLVCNSCGQVQEYTLTLGAMNWVGRQTYSETGYWCQTCEDVKDMHWGNIRSDETCRCNVCNFWALLFVAQFIFICACWVGTIWYILWSATW